MPLTWSRCDCRVAGGFLLPAGRIDVVEVSLGAFLIRGALNDFAIASGLSVVRGVPLATGREPHQPTACTVTDSVNYFFSYSLRFFVSYATFRYHCYHHHCRRYH